MPPSTPLPTLSPAAGTIGATLKLSDYVTTFRATLPGLVTVTVPIKLTRAGNRLLRAGKPIRVRAVASFTAGTTHISSRSRAFTLRTTG